MQRAAARHDHADGDGPLGMQPLEVLQVAVEERVLVVPLDFERDDGVDPFR